MGEKNEEIMKMYIVRVFCQNKGRFIPFKEDELDTKKFPEKVANVFGLKFGADVYSGLVLTDNLGLEIPKNLLADVIKNFHNGSMFYINVEYRISDSCRSQIELVTPMMLEDYFRRQNAGKLLINKNDQQLNDSIRKQVVNVICNFMVEAFGDGDPNKISKRQKEITCETATKLFIGLKSKDDDNALSKLLGVGGYVNNKLKYLSSKYKNIASNSQESSDGADSVQTSPEEDLLFLKNCIIKDTELDIVTSKLNSTRFLRKNMMANHNIDLRESFPFFFSDSQLISIDFDRNPEFNRDSNGFVKNWPSYAPKLKSMFGLEIDLGWEKSIECLLFLLHVFPSRSHQLPLSDAIEKLIVFQVIGTPPEAMIRNNNDHPYIVGYGYSKMEIVSYYIEAERHLIPLPSRYGIVETFDVFFKLHHIFDLKFDKAVENMIVFIQRLVYNFQKGKQATATMKNVFEKVSD